MDFTGFSPVQYLEIFRHHCYVEQDQLRLRGEIGGGRSVSWNVGRKPCLCAILSVCARSILEQTLWSPGLRLRSGRRHQKNDFLRVAPTSGATRWLTSSFRESTFGK